MRHDLQLRAAAQDLAPAGWSFPITAITGDPCGPFHDLLRPLWLSSWGFDFPITRFPDLPIFGFAPPLPPYPSTRIPKGLHHSTPGLTPFNPGDDPCYPGSSVVKGWIFRGSNLPNYQIIRGPQRARFWLDGVVTHLPNQLIHGDPVNHHKHNKPNSLPYHCLTRMSSEIGAWERETEAFS
jgi:hypothetical protein